MKIKIPVRVDAPETNLYVEILTKNNISFGTRSIMLLVPGGPGGNHTVFNAIKEDLFQFSDLILFDPRGCGNSDDADPIFCTIDHYINDIEAIRKHFNLNKIILLGGSYGAMASMGYAIKFGLFVEKLILIAGAPSFHFIETAQKNLKERGTPEQNKAAEDLWNGTFKNSEHFKEYYKIMASLYLYKQPEIKNSLPTIKTNIPCEQPLFFVGAGIGERSSFDPIIKKLATEKYYENE